MVSPMHSAIRDLPCPMLATLVKSEDGRKSFEDFIELLTPQR
jgi:hypothetical protein